MAVYSYPCPFVMTRQPKPFLQAALLTNLYIDAGELQSVDGYMNIALEQTCEVVEGKVKREYGDAFIRGNNGERCLLLLFSLDARGRTQS